MYHQRGLEKEAYKAMIYELTDGRTDKTNELTQTEAYYLMGFLNGNSDKSLKDLSKESEQKELKFYRSAVLKRLQKIGVDTTSWQAVNSYLSDKRIAGGPMYTLSVEQLKLLIPKLERICAKKMQ